MPDESKNSPPEPDFFDSLVTDAVEFLFGKPEPVKKVETKEDDTGGVEEPGKVKKKRSGTTVNIGGLAKEIGDLITESYERGKRDAEPSAKKGKAAGEQKPEDDEKPE